MIQRRFWPLFWTQALGSFNDNLIKNAIVILITFKSVSLFGLSPEKLVALSGAIFISPFFLFSAVAGELADQRSKSRLSTFTKLWEVLIALFAAAGFYFESLPFLLFCLFMLGMQATFFGPIKYGILPELLGPQELLRGNAFIELGTFVAILLGTISGGVLMGLAGAGPVLVSIAGVVVAVSGWIMSRRIEFMPARAPEVRVSLNPIAPTLELFRISKKVKSVQLSILAISWFWLLGSVILSMLPHLVKDVIGAPESVLTFFLALFSIGVGFGSVLSERISGKTLELALVPIGSFGMSLFMLDIGICPLPTATSILEVLSTASGVRLCLDLFLFSLSAGIFTLPLYTLLQLRSAEKERSRVVAANNVLNALFMIIGALALMGLYALNLSVPQIFAVLGCANILVAIYIYTVLPEFIFRFGCWILTPILYRLRVIGKEHMPELGPAILVCNHVSFVDWILISSISPRPIRFVMHYSFLKLPLMGWFFRQGKVIPIAGQKEDPAILASAMELIASELTAGELVCVFPEGEITRNGEMNTFRRGIERVLERNPVPVVPMALSGLWGSFFSRRYGRAMSKPFTRVWSQIALAVGEPKRPEGLTASELETTVAGLLKDADALLKKS